MPRLSWLVPTALVVACNGSPPAPVALAAVSEVSATASSPPEKSAQPRPSSTAIAVPEPFATLFEPGRSWTVRVTNKSQLETDPPEVTVHDSSCHVARVRPLARALVSEIDCPELVDDGIEQPLGGIWLATSKGLYRLRAWPKSLEELDPKQLLFAFPTAPHNRQRVDGEGGGEKESIERHGAGWCHHLSYWGGDEAWSSVCIEGGVGFTAATWGWAGGSIHENTLAVLGSARQH